MFDPDLLQEGKLCDLLYYQWRKRLLEQAVVGKDDMSCIRLEVGLPVLFPTSCC